MCNTCRHCAHADVHHVHALEGGWAALAYESPLTAHHPHASYALPQASGKFMPAGLVMVISGIMSAVFAVSLQSAASQVDAAAKSK